MAISNDPVGRRSEAKPFLSHHIQVVVSSGVTSSGFTIGDLDSITVLSGGVASATTVGAGGDEFVSSGGTTFNDVISGGFESVFAGGVASGLTLSSGEVDGPGELWGATIDDGLVSGAILGGSTEEFGGTVEGVTVGRGAGILLDGGAGSGILVSGSGALLTLNNDGVTVSSLVLESGGATGLSVGSFIGGAIVLNGGFLEDESGTVSGVVVSSGGVEGLDEGDSVDQGTTVSEGGLEFVQGGGVASGTVVSSGGAETINGQGAVDDAHILNGGVLTVSRGGVASGATVSGGGVENVGSGGSDGGATILAGGVLKLTAGAGITGDTVSSGGTLDLVDMTVVGGSAFFLALPNAVTTVVSNVTLEGGGMLAMEDPTVNSGGELVLGAGTFTGGVIVSAGGVLAGPGELKGQAPSLDYGLVSGVGLGDAFGGHGELVVESGGVASNVLEDGPGDYLVADSGGVATNTRMTGAQASFVIEHWGRASGTVLEGADALIFGSATATRISSGGVEYVESGGTTRWTSVQAGGHEVVEAHGTAFVAAIGRGGLLTVAAGGAIAGGLKLFGGLAVISGTAAAGQTVTFPGSSAVLELANLPGFHARISGLATAGQKIDLDGFAFSVGETVTWTQHGTSGTLAVQDGARSASLTLIGTYVTSDFHLGADGHGGTFVSDPPTTPAAAPAPARFAQALAGFHGGRGAPGPVVIHSGGTALLSATPLAALATSGR